MDSPISHPPLKRPRTESQPKPNRSVPWFDDGNIILEAELSQFRVYRGILSAHSVIFKNMFDLAQPSEGENVGSCPVVHLSDRAQDVRIILEVLHNSIHSYISLKGTISLAMVAAFLRLGTKYEILELRTEAIRRLFNDFPHDFAIFNRGRTTSTRLINERTVADVVSLAREMNILSILPAALYYCCEIYTTGEILGGRRRQDGSMAIMSVHDQRICLLGRDELTRLQVKETFVWLMKDEGRINCSGLACEYEKKTLVRDVLILSKPCLALHRWERSWERKLCNPCLEAFKDAFAAGRTKIWSMLPAIFDLPSWEELLISDVLPEL